MKTWAVNILKSKEKLCFFAFLLALCSIFEGFVFHAADFLDKHHLIPAVYAATEGDKNEK